MVFSNTHKLAIFVLVFFLALTYVRASNVDTDTKNVVFEGEAPFEFIFSVTNTLNVSQKPSIVADGPFALLLSDAEREMIIPAHDTIIYHAILTPSPLLKVGDIYQSQVRVIFSNEEKTLPLTITKKNAPFIPPSLGTGFVSLFKLPPFEWVDFSLILIVLVLGIALVARIRTRVVGGKK